jgi:hypothetical protein
MKKILLLLFILATVFAGCKKDEEDPDYNLFRITSGTYNGFSYQFNINKGFWAQVNQDTRSYSLVFGDDQDPPAATNNFGRAFLYYDGTNNTIPFPSPEGQQLNFSFDLQEDGSVCTLQYQDATITVEEVSDSEIKGRVTGEFINSCDAETVNVEMDFSIALEAL